MAGQSRKNVPLSTNPTEVKVIDSEQLSQAVEALLGKNSPEAVALKSVKRYFPPGTELPATIRRSASVDANGPFPIVMQVRKALEAQQLNSVRHLLSDQLYQRLSAAPPVPPAAGPDRLFMIVRKHPGDDPNRVIVRIGGSVAVPGATAEDWILVRAPQVSTAVPVPPTPPTPLSACPYCAAQLDTGATRCRFCGMDVTLAMPTSVPSPATTPEAHTGVQWIVDDISAANPLAA